MNHSYGFDRSVYWLYFIFFLLLFVLCIFVVLFLENIDTAFPENDNYVKKLKAAIHRQLICVPMNYWMGFRENLIGPFWWWKGLIEKGISIQYYIYSTSVFKTLESCSFLAAGIRQMLSSVLCQIITLKVFAVKRRWVYHEAQGWWIVLWVN